MKRPPSSLSISVIIPTHNRAELLRESLSSLAEQTLPARQFEVVVIDDGSSDHTPQVCSEMGQRLQLRYFRLNHAGISAAKNLGVFTSKAPILLFFDDDDIADPGLLMAHLQTHGKHPDQAVAVLGYTTWASALRVTPVMNYVTDVGHFLFSYSHLKDGQELDFTYFWGGRSSCKRSLLVRHGIFRQEFQFGSEDIELGYRLSRFGLKVVYNRQAVQYMNRPLTYDEFCRRCEKQGISQYFFARVHADPKIQQYCQLERAQEKWSAAKVDLPEQVSRVRELEALLDGQPDPHLLDRQLEELHSLYRTTFNAFKLKGIVGAMQAGESHHAYASEPAPVMAAR